MAAPNNQAHALLDSDPDDAPLRIPRSPVSAPPLYLPFLEPILDEFVANVVAKTVQSHIDAPDQNLACMLHAAYRVDLISRINVILKSEPRGLSASIEWTLAPHALLTRRAAPLDLDHLYLCVSWSTNPDNQKVWTTAMSTLFREDVEVRFEQLRREHAHQMFLSQWMVNKAFKQMSPKPPGPQSWFLS